MVVLSFLFHMALFSVILFIPESLPTRKIEGKVYQVNLVDMPAGGGRRDVAKKSSSVPQKSKGVPVPKSKAPTRRIKSVQKETITKMCGDCSWVETLWDESPIRVWISRRWFNRSSLIKFSCLVNIPPISCGICKVNRIAIFIYRRHPC